MRRVQKYMAVAGVLLTLAVLPTPTALAVRTTTAPGSSVLVYFVFTDQKLSYEILREVLGGGSNQLLLERNVVRGDNATFYVINRGHKPHGFTFYGHTIPPLRPGGRTHFSAALLRRGSFPYASTTDKGKAFRGVFLVA